MKFKVSGANRDTGARMTLEFEADSKGAAERKATQSGMEVHRVENLSEGTERADDAEAHRGGEGSFGLALRFLILVGIAVAAFWWFYWRKHGHLPGL